MARPLASKGTPLGPFQPGIPTTDVGSQYNLYVNVTTSLAVVLAASVLAMPAAVIGMVCPGESGSSPVRHGSLP